MGNDDMSEGLARLEALLTQHMTTSQAEARERAKENEALRVQIGVVDSRVQTLTNKQLELEQRQTRLERSHEQTHGIAVGARESHDELHGVVMRELTNVKRETSHQSTVLATHSVVLDAQNKALADIKSGTDEIVEAERFRKREAAAWEKRRAAISSWAKLIVGVITALGAIGTIVWAVFKIAVEHAR